MTEAIPYAMLLIKKSIRNSMRSLPMIKPDTVVIITPVSLSRLCRG